MSCPAVATRRHRRRPSPRSLGHRRRAAPTGGWRIAGDAPQTTGRSGLPGIAKRDNVVDLHRGRGTDTPNEVDRLAGVWILQDAGADDAGRARPVNDLRQVPFQDIVAGIAAVVVDVLPCKAELVTVIADHRCGDSDPELGKLRLRRRHPTRRWTRGRQRRRPGENQPNHEHQRRPAQASAMAWHGIRAASASRKRFRLCRRRVACCMRSRAGRAWCCA